MACCPRDPVCLAFCDSCWRTTCWRLVRCARWISREDFTSRPAYLQALLVQAFSVGVGFLMFGAVIGTKIKAIRFSQAVWVVNPIAVGVGFGVYKWIYHSLRFARLLPEYDSLSIFALFIITAPVIFAFCLLTGACLRQATAQLKSSRRSTAS